MKIPETFTVNPFSIISNNLSPGFTNEKNEVGMSSLGYGKRRTIMRKFFDMKNIAMMSADFGTIIHKLIEWKPNRTEIVRDINTDLGLDVEPISYAEVEGRLEIYKNHFIRMHPDILTPNYIIEIKTTAMPVRSWTGEVADAHIRQLNGYMGHFKRDYGFLMMINKNAFMSASKSFERILNDYMYLLKFDFNQELYDNTLKIAQFILEHIDNEDFNVACPIHTWECNGWCRVRDDCPNPITYVKLKEVQHCSVCNTKLIEGVNVLERKGNYYCKTELNGEQPCVQEAIDAWGHE